MLGKDLDKNLESVDNQSNVSLDSLPDIADNNSKQFLQKKVEHMVKDSKSDQRNQTSHRPDINTLHKNTPNLTSNSNRSYLKKPSLATTNFQSQSHSQNNQNLNAEQLYHPERKQIYHQPDYQELMDRRFPNSQQLYCQNFKNNPVNHNRSNPLQRNHSPKLNTMDQHGDFHHLQGTMNLTCQDYYHPDNQHQRQFLHYPPFSIKDIFTPIPLPVHLKSQHFFPVFQNYHYGIKNFDNREIGPINLDDNQIDSKVNNYLSNQTNSDSSETNEWRDDTHQNADTLDSSLGDKKNLFTNPQPLIADHIGNSFKEFKNELKLAKMIVKHSQIFSETFSEFSYLDRVSKIDDQNEALQFVRDLCFIPKKSFYEQMEQNAATLLPINNSQSYVNKKWPFQSGYDHNFDSIDTKRFKSLTSFKKHSWSDAEIKNAANLICECKKKFYLAADKVNRRVIDIIELYYKQKKVIREIQNKNKKIPPPHSLPVTSAQTNAKLPYISFSKPVHLSKENNNNNNLQNLSNVSQTLPKEYSTHLDIDTTGERNISNNLSDHNLTTTVNKFINPNHVNKKPRISQNSASTLPNNMIEYEKPIKKGHDEPKNRIKGQTLSQKFSFSNFSPSVNPLPSPDLSRNDQNSSISSEQLGKDSDTLITDEKKFNSENFLPLDTFNNTIKIEKECPEI